MSCDMTKLEYLEETKQIIRNTIDPNGAKITDNTPFREYVDFMGNNLNGTMYGLLAGTNDTISGRLWYDSDNDINGVPNADKYEFVFNVDGTQTGSGEFTAEYAKINAPTFNSCAFGYLETIKMVDLLNVSSITVTVSYDNYSLGAFMCLHTASASTNPATIINDVPSNHKMAIANCSTPTQITFDTSLITDYLYIMFVCDRSTQLKIYDITLNYESEE